MHWCFLVASPSLEFTCRWGGGRGGLVPLVAVTVEGFKSLLRVQVQVQGFFLSVQHIHTFPFFVCALSFLKSAHMAFSCIYGGGERMDSEEYTYVAIVGI